MIVQGERSGGPRLLRVQLTSGAGPSEQSATIDGEFASGTETMRRILFNNSDEMNPEPAIVKCLSATREGLAVSIIKMAMLGQLRLDTRAMLA